MKRKIILVFAMLAAIIVPNITTVAEQGGSNVERTASTIRYYENGKIRFGLYSGIVNYEVGGEYVPIDTTIVDSDDVLYDYEVLTGVYQAYFKQDPTEGQAVKYVKDGVEITLQPLALNYRNDLDQIQQIEMVNSVAGYPNENEFMYENAYGDGVDLRYIYWNEVLKEELMIENSTLLAAPQQYIIDGGNPTLDIDFVFDTNSNHIVIEGVDWDKKNTATSQNEVYIKDDSDNVLYYLPKPYAYDDDGDSVLLEYVFKKQGNSLIVTVKTPYSWVENAAYPIFIDPSFKLQTADTQTLDDSKISKTAGDTNYGSETDYAVGTFSGLKLYVLIQFNMSSVDDQCGTITGANVSLYRYDAGDTPHYYIWGINTTVQPWNEGTVTWNNYPCGEAGASWDDEKCNSVYDSDTVLPGAGVLWFNQTVITSAQNQVDRGQNNFSFVITGGSATNGNSFRSKEYATAAQRPILWIECDEPAPPADTTPPELVESQAWCWNCDFDPQITDEEYGITNYTQTTINFTTDEDATCAIIANESLFGNLNYTDMIAAGGVECETTGGTNQDCTIQASNKFTTGTDKAAFLGCKDGSNNEKTNATFSYHLKVYTLTGTTDTCDLGCLTISPGCSAFANPGCTYISPS